MDLAYMDVPLAGRLAATGERWEPYRLLDADGVTAEAARAYFGHLQAAGRAEATIRSYGLDLRISGWRNRAGRARLLNEMDGLGSDIDVTFLLTTNRADLLEQALAARPGRVDHAAELPVPEAAARSRLLRLYQGRLKPSLSDPESVITRTEGVTASCIKEMLRRAALVAVEEDDSTGDVTDAPITVTDSHLSVALDQLLDTRSRLTHPCSAAARQSGSKARPRCDVRRHRARAWADLTGRNGGRR